MNALRKTWDRFRGSGESAITVPPMDGILRPNTQLEDTNILLSVKEPDNLVLHDGEVYFTSGSNLCQLNRQAGLFTVVRKFPANITCLATTADGRFVVGLNSGMLVISNGTVAEDITLTELADRPLRSPTAVATTSDGAILLCLGSQDCDAEDWKMDLMSRNSSGSVWEIAFDPQITVCLADNLAFPNGIAVDGNGDVVFSESWRSRIRAIRPDRTLRTVLSEIPGYPGQLSQIMQGSDIWLSVFAPRNQLVEFVLSETTYRREMVQRIHPDHWVAPSYYPARSYLEPLQGGALKQLGEMKDWAPSRSYGLLVRLNCDLQPVQSYHSRASGKRHGIVSCVVTDSDVLVASRGSQEILSLETKV